MKTLIKKAGIVVAAVTAGLLSLAPLAMAGGEGKDGEKKGKHHGADVKNSSIQKCEAKATADNSDLVSILDINVTGVLQNVCLNDVLNNNLNDLVDINVGDNNNSGSKVG